MLSQGDLPDPGLNPGLLHCRWILYQLSHKGNNGKVIKDLIYRFNAAAAAAATKSLQSSLTLCNPRDGTHQAPPSLGYFRHQEHWSGLPFPSPMHKSEKLKLGRSVVSKS